MPKTHGNIRNIMLPVWDLASLKYHVTPWHLCRSPISSLKRYILFCFNKLDLLATYGRYPSKSVALKLWHIQKVSSATPFQHSSKSWSFKRVIRMGEIYQDCLDHSFSLPIEAPFKKYRLFWLQVQTLCGRYQQDVVKSGYPTSCGRQKDRMIS